MDLSLDLLHRQTQKLIITQEVQQSLEILQFSSQELHEYIQQLMETNPLLEAAEDDLVRDERLQNIHNPPVDWAEYFKDLRYDDHDMDNSAYQEDDRSSIYESMTAQEITLRDHLLLQLKEMKISAADKKIAHYIIENLDDNGYLKTTKYEIASALNVDRDKVNRLLRLIQTFEPAGVGARSLRECLLIQLAQKGKLTPAVETVVLNHLKDVANNQLHTIRRKLGITMSETLRIVYLIKSLEPKPGRQFSSSDRISYIIPDIRIQSMDGKYLVQVQDIAAPRLHINSVYRNMLENSLQDPLVKEYLAGKMRSALLVIKSIEQRRNTIHKVASSVVKFQRNFLDRGIMHLKPLTLNMVAGDIGLHESTVSRAINGKYIQTPRGVFDLKFFFGNGITAGGEEISSQSIKQIIEKMISNENKGKPFSDQKIAENLKKMGIEISRRTVAKYRDELGILSSSKRRRY